MPVAAGFRLAVHDEFLIESLVEEAKKRSYKIVRFDITR
jgi:hypothetical protein